MNKHDIRAGLLADMLFVHRQGKGMGVELEYEIQSFYNEQSTELPMLTKGKQTHPPKNYSNRKPRKW